MDVTLVMFKADDSRRDFPVRKNRIVIGRKNTCGLRIPLSAISRQHCEIRVTDDGIILKDLGSSNGTYHNSIRVQEAELTAGDEVSVGPVVFTVVVDGRPADIRPVRTVLDSTTPLGAPAGSDDRDEPVEIADLAIDDDADLMRELNDELASADLLATPSVDEPPAAGLEDSDLDFSAVPDPDPASAAAPPAASPVAPPATSPVAPPAPPADPPSLSLTAPDESGLDLDALFAESDNADDSGVGKKRSSSPTTPDSSSILDFDFDELDDI